MTTSSEPALERARAELREMAMDLVLSRRCLFTRLACRAVEHGGSMQAALKHGFRKLLVLVHPDKNNGSAKSELAAKELQKLREQPAPVCCGDEVHEASSPGGASASCARLGGFFYATYFHAYFGDTLYGKRLRNFIYGDRLGGVLYTTCFGKRLRGFLYGNRLGDFQHGDGLGGVLYTTCFCADRLGDFYAELRAFFYLDPG
ncbi:unnamed protein product, partial [Symbiodinium sp. KB8]